MRREPTETSNENGRIRKTVMKTIYDQRTFGKAAGNELKVGANVMAKAGSAAAGAASRWSNGEGRPA